MLKIARVRPLVCQKGPYDPTPFEAQVGELQNGNSTSY